jgi:D-alanine-D-alanine ligase
MTKLRVGLLYGGRSVEHEVSIASAASIFRALDPARYDVRLVGVDPQGRWHLAPPDRPPQAELAGEPVRLAPEPGAARLLAADGRVAAEIDVVFPIVHGRGGEDGTLQGLLEMAEVPYVGSGVLGSAVQMDKEISKRLLAAAGLPVLPSLCVRHAEIVRDARAAAARVLAALALPVFVKPANLGSSVGIHRVAREADLAPALEDAVRYDPKLVVEQGIAARDVEVALLGDDAHVEASVPGEIRTTREFYDYEAKYVDEATELLVPAPVSDALAQRLRDAAIAAFVALEGRGLGRVDFLVERESERFYLNEVNSLPGFTDVSMYPRLWEASGLAYPALLDRLIELALESHRRRSKLETQYRTRR